MMTQTIAANSDRSRRELFHVTPVAKAGDVVRIQFPGGESIDVLVGQVDDDWMDVTYLGHAMRFLREMMPFDLPNTAIGDVHGEVIMWKCREVPEAPLGYVSDNHGRVN